MADQNLQLYVASYEDAAAAEADYKSLKKAQAAEDFAVVGAVVASRNDAGDVTVDEHGSASPVGRDAALGGVGGLVVGLFAPPLLLATAVGAGIGAGIGGLKKRHEQKQMGVDVEEYLPPGSSAVIVLVDDVYLDRVERALDKLTKKINKAVDSGDYDKLTKELDAADKRVSKAVRLLTAGPGARAARGPAISRSEPGAARRRAPGSLVRCARRHAPTPPSWDSPTREDAGVRTDVRASRPQV